jgi:hypothetical protein
MSKPVHVYKYISSENLENFIWVIMEAARTKHKPPYPFANILRSTWPSKEGWSDGLTRDILGIPNTCVSGARDLCERCLTIERTSQ